MWAIRSIVCVPYWVFSFKICPVGRTCSVLLEERAPQAEGQGLRGNALGRLAGPDHRPIGQDDRTELESSTATGAHDRLPRLKIVSFDLGQIEAIAQLDESADGIESYFAVGIHEAEVANLHESGRQHVLQEASDEFHDIESHGSPTRAPRLFVAKGDDSILHFHNAAVGDGHLEDIRGKILEAGRAFAHRLAVDVPLDFPDLGRDLVKEAGSLHFVSELGPEDLGEGLYRQIEIDPGRMPGAVFGQKGSSGGNVVDMGMILEGAPPRMEHAKETGKIAPHMLFIAGKLFYGLGG